jgi:hypothetical protein
MATTTNYGWTTPDDTALVKDGAAAIRTLGSSVDTTTKNLNPETTLGDLAYRSSTANVKTRLALGTANQQLRVNSAATAPEWFTPSGAGMALVTSNTFSGVTTVSVNNCFSATYDAYKIVVEMTATNQVNAFTIRTRVSGSDETGSVYSDVGSWGNNTNQTSLRAGWTGNPGAANAVFDIFNPFLATTTQVAGVGGALDVASGVSAFMGHVNNTTSYTGFTFNIAAVTISGRYKVYGYPL